MDERGWKPWLSVIAAILMGAAMYFGLSAQRETLTKPDAKAVAKSLQAVWGNAAKPLR